MNYLFIFFIGEEKERQTTKLNLVANYRDSFWYCDGDFPNCDLKHLLK